MSLFNSQSFIVKREVAGSYVEGEWTPGGTSSFSIKGTFQPGNAERLQTTLEGRRVSGVGELFSGSKLRTVDLSGKTGPDRVIIGGAEWEVIQASSWQNGLIPHYEYIVILPKEGGL